MVIRVNWRTIDEDSFNKTVELLILRRYADDPARYVRVIDSFEPIGMTGSGKVQKIKLRAHAIKQLGLEATK